MSEVHAQARTTPRTRTEIKESTATLAELAERYNISKLTARKWKNRESPEDRSHRPHKLNTTLTPAQEAIAVDPDGHPKLLHCWPVKLLQAGRGDYAGSEVMIRRAAASLSL